MTDEEREQYKRMHLEIFAGKLLVIGQLIWTVLKSIGLAVALYYGVVYGLPVLMGAWKWLMLSNWKLHGY